MLNYEDITEEMVRKYATSDIVHALNESIASYTKWNMWSMEALKPDYTEDEKAEMIKNSHVQAMDWLKRNYYTLYIDPDTPERQQMQVNLEKLELAASLDNLAGEQVHEIEMIKV